MTEDNPHEIDVEKMMEESMKENEKKVGDALEQIEIIQQMTEMKNLNIKFPRGVIRTADYFIGKLPFIKDGILRTNIAYTLMTTDFYRWLLNRFGIDRTIKEMVIKELICLYGHIIEAICKHICESCQLTEPHDYEGIENVRNSVRESVEDEYLRNNILSYLGNLPHREVGITRALTLLLEKEIIGDELKDELLGIWEIRCKEHLTTIREKEYCKYDYELGKGTIETFNEFMDLLIKATEEEKI